MSGNLPTVKLLSHCLDFLHAHPSAFQPMVLLRFWSLDFCVWAGPLAVMAWFRIALVLSVSFRCPGTSWSFASGSHGAMSWLRSSLIGPLSRVLPLLTYPNCIARWLFSVLLTRFSSGVTLMGLCSLRMPEQSSKLRLSPPCLGLSPLCPVSCPSDPFSA